MNRLCRAGAANHQSFFAFLAEQAGGLVRHRHNGVIAETPGRSLMVAFPEVPDAELSGFADEVLALARQNPDHVKEIGYWILDEGSAKAVGARLLARGFDWGWRPNWMVLDLSKPITEHPAPDGLLLESQDHRISARVGGREVGKITWHVTDYEGQPTGGIYDTEVEEKFRRQGIGTALTVSACHALADAGCRHVLLNATGMGVGVYRRAGFELIGEVGQTWWLPGEQLLAPPPSAAAVAFAEAIGLGDPAAAKHALDDDSRLLDAPLASGRTALEIAAGSHQEEIARWLIDRGAPLDVISAWELGWKAEAAEALRRDPTLANRPGVGGRLFPLHIAGQRGDLELTRILLDSRPDLSVTDGFIGKDPVQWARLHGHDQVASMITDHS